MKRPLVAIKINTTVYQTSYEQQRSYDANARTLGAVIHRPNSSFRQRNSLQGCPCAHPSALLRGWRRHLAQGRNRTRTSRSWRSPASWMAVGCGALGIQIRSKICIQAQKHMGTTHKAPKREVNRELSENQR